MTWIQNLRYKFLCQSKGHIQVRDWQMPSFPALGYCNRCGVPVFIKWTPPSIFNVLFSGK